MDHGLYTTYLGMRARQRALDVIANNIANAATPGFKANRLLYRSVEAAEIEATANGGQAHRPGLKPGSNLAGGAADRSLSISHGRFVSVVAMTTADHSPGMIRHTGRDLDIALDGEGFLVVQTPRGERYARAGSLKVDVDGHLVTQSGDLVAGEAGPITIGPGRVVIGESGEVSVDGQPAGRLKLVKFDRPAAALVKEGEALFALDAAGGAQPQPVSVRVVQGALEMSNVDPISEMAAMIQNSREFDSLQRSITMLMSDLGRKVAGEIGRL